METAPNLKNPGAPKLAGDSSCACCVALTIYGLGQPLRTVLNNPSLSFVLSDYVDGHLYLAHTSTPPSLSVFHKNPFQGLQAFDPDAPVYHGEELLVGILGT